MVDLFQFVSGFQIEASESLDSADILNDAWKYVSVKGETDRWIILNSKKLKE